MNAGCEHLPWDTAFFGFKVARVLAGTIKPGDGRAVLSWCHREGVRLLYFLAGDDLASWAEATDTGFRLVDIRVDLVLDSSRTSTPPTMLHPGVTLREATLEDLPNLLPLARTVHVDSRFLADPAVPRDKAGELFAVWLRRSVERAIADVVFVAEAEGRAISYVTAKLAGGVGSIGLVGVGEAARGRGIGLATVQRALQWFHAHEAKEVRVVTQGRNVSAQRLYARCGFVTASCRLWFHRWFQ